MATGDFSLGGKCLRSGTFIAECVFIGLADPSIVAGIPSKIILPHLEHVNYRTDSEASGEWRRFLFGASAIRYGAGP
jgi:hypothetical protein